MTRLICETCRRRWSPGRGEKRQRTCPKCHHRNLSAGAKRRHRVRKLLGGAGVAIEPPATTPLPSLSELMADADAKAAKAVEMARSIAARFSKSPPSRS